MLSLNIKETDRTINFEVFLRYFKTVLNIFKEEIIQSFEEMTTEAAETCILLEVW